MVTLELTVRCILEVDEDTATAIKQTPTGFLKFSDEPLGSEELTVGPMNGPPVEPSQVDVKLVELPARRVGGCAK